MKKLALLPILLMTLASAVLAADQAGDPCQTTGRVSLAGAGEILACANGKWALPGQVGTFGPVMPPDGTTAPMPARTQYTVKLAASKI